MVVKMKMLHGCLAVLLLTAIALSVRIATYEPPKCDRIHLEDLNEHMKLWGTKDAIPNKEMARQIADIIVSEYGFITEGERYEVGITFDEQYYEWRIYYSARHVDENGQEHRVFGGGVEIHLRRDCGMVTYLFGHP